MLTGRRVFPGDDLSDTFAAILRADPDWTALPPSTPTAIRRLLRRALEKDVRSRLPDMSIVRVELRDAEIEPREVGGAATTVPTPPRSVLRRLAPYAAMIVVALVTGGAVWRFREPVEAPHPLTRFSIDLFDQAQQLIAVRNPAAISPDGTRIVYAANQRLYLRAMDQLEATAIPGTEGGGASVGPRDPFFSPDNQWVGFWQDAQLKKVALAGGRTRHDLQRCPRPTTGHLMGTGRDLVGLAQRHHARGASRRHTRSAGLASRTPNESAFHKCCLAASGSCSSTIQPVGGIEQSQAVVHSTQTGERRALVERWCQLRATFVAGTRSVCRARSLFSRSRLMSSTSG